MAMRSMTGPVLVTMLLAGSAGAEAPSAAVEAQRHPSGWELATEGQLGLSLNRLGALVDLKLRAKRPLYASDSEFFRDNFVSLGPSLQLSPIFAHAGAQVDLQPASFVKLSAGYHSVGYFGTYFGSLRQPTGCENAASLAASDPRCDFHPITFEDEPPGQLGDGHRLWVEGTLMGKVRPVIAVGSARVERWLMNTPGEFWVNELSGLPLRRADTSLTGGGAVLYELLHPEGARPELLVGAADEFAWAVGTNALWNRVGPVVSLRAPHLGAWREVTAQLAVLLYTHERYLAGGPYLALAVSTVTPDFLAPSRH